MPTPADDDRPFDPPDMDTGAGALRWVIGGVASVLLIVGAWRAYEWLVADVERRRTAAEAPPVTLTASAPPPVATLPAPADTSPRPRPAPAPATMRSSPRPQSSAVAGVAGVNKCVHNGQVTYTNAPCPANDTLAEAATDSATAVPLPPVALNAHSPGSTRRSVCNHLLAEVARLNFEFQQPLPPPVLDHISSHLAMLRSQHAEAQCPPLPKPLSQTPGAQAKVVDEKNGD